jgi:hypothetical protein
MENPRLITPLTDEGMMRAASALRDAADQMNRLQLSFEQLDSVVRRFEEAVERFIVDFPSHGEII